MNVSLTKFCKDNALPKSSVHRRCIELGFDTSNGLSPEYQNQILFEFNVEPEAEAVQVTVESGNHTSTLARPELPTELTLENLRTKEFASYESPLAIADQFVGMAGQIKTAMDLDIERRKQEIRETEQATQKITQAAQELLLEKRLYQMQADNLAEKAADKTEALQTALKVLSDLGK